MFRLLVAIFLVLVVSFRCAAAAEADKNAAKSDNTELREGSSDVLDRVIGKKVAEGEAFGEKAENVKSEPTDGQNISPVMLTEVKFPPVGNVKRRERFVELLVRAGAKPEDISRTKVYRSKEDDQNVVVSLPGSDENVKHIVIGAHTDSFQESPGALDNWSGAVMLAALYEKFRQGGKPRHTLIFTGFASEEHGGDGSTQYVRELGRSGRSRIMAMVNLECLGADLPRTWCNRSADKLEKTIVRAGGEIGLEVKKQVLFGYTADAFAFSRAGIPAVTVHSLGPDKLKLINGMSDKPACIDMNNYRRSFELLVRTVELLDDETDEISPTDQERKFRAIPKTLYLSAFDDPESGVTIVDLPRFCGELDAGIREGDKVTAINGFRIDTRRDMLPILLSLRRGEKIPVSLVRKEKDGKEKTVSIELLY